EIEMPAGTQMLPDRGQELQRSNGVREHVLGDNQIERAVERNREVVEIDGAARRKAVDLLDEKLLVLEERHDRTIRGIEALQRSRNAPEPRPNLQHARLLQRNQRTEELDVDGIC